MIEKKKAITLDLNGKIKVAQDVIKKAHEKYGDDIYIEWTAGKDSQTVLWLAMSAVKGWKPKVLFFDNDLHFDEMYKMRDEIVKKYNLKLVVARYEDLIKEYYSLDKESRKEFSRVHKSKAMNRIIKEKNIKVLMTCIHKNKHVTKLKETYSSERKTYMRIHPILHFDKKEISKYIKTHNIPYTQLYNKEYRTLSEKYSDKEKKQIEKTLKALGYF